MKPLVFVDGDQGTTGLQIVSRLQRRDDLALLALAPAHRRDPARRAEAFARCDVAILCLPDEAARDAVAAVTQPSTRIIDASSAHRIASGWVYGFAEMDAGQPARIAAAGRVSNPGCYPTGAIALLRPLVDAALVPAGYPVTIHAVSGYSGGGRERVAQYEGEPRGDAPALEVYALGLAHKHVPEIQRHAGLDRRPLFVPAYGAWRQGIVLTIPLHRELLAPHVSGARIHEALRARYAGSPAIELMPFGAQAPRTLDAQALAGTDRLRLAVFESPDGAQVLLAAVFDNLGKGAAGAAVQNLDLMLGIR